MQMGYDGAYTAGLVTLSTLLGVLSLPFVLGNTFQCDSNQAALRRRSSQRINATTNSANVGNW